MLAVTAATKGGMAALFGVGMLLVVTNATLQPDEMNLWEGLMRALWLVAGCYYVTAVFVGIWLYRASCNAHALTSRMENAPGLAVGWYFVPFANLIMPFRALDEIWRVTHAADRWQGAATSPRLRLWWGAWLAADVLSLPSSLAFLGQPTPTRLMYGYGFGVVAALFAVIAALALRGAVNRVTLLQMQRLSSEQF